METCDFQAPAKQKPLNRSIRNITFLVMSVGSTNVTQMVRIGWLGAATHTGGVYLDVAFSHTLYLINAYGIEMAEDQRQMSVQLERKNQG
jgi:hypothetical protein